MIQPGDHFYNTLLEINDTARHLRPAYEHKPCQMKLAQIINLCKTVSENLERHNDEAVRDASIEMAATAMLLVDKIEMKEETVR